MIWTYWLSIGWTQAMQNIRWSFSLLNDKWAIRWGLSPNQQIETCFYSQIWVIFSDWGDIKICWFPTTFPIHFDISRWNLRHIWHIPSKMAHQKMIKSKVHPIDLKICFSQCRGKPPLCENFYLRLGDSCAQHLGQLWAEGLRGWMKSVSKIPKNLLVELRGLKFCANTKRSKRLGIS